MTTPRRPNRTQAVLESHVGYRLRELRQERGLSLGEVSEATGISTSFLSLVETGRSDITLGRLMRLVKFYDTSVEELLPQPPSLDASLVRAHDRLFVPSPAEGMDVYLLSPDTERTMMPLIVHFAPDAGLAEYASHEGEEFIHVIEGALQVTVEEETVIVHAGDSFYFSAEHPHSLKNVFDGTTKIFAVVSPPSLGRGPGDELRRRSSE
jgi:quercetin dioxygenase-like cupin family protein/DNA-binding Xre family transcriptional regulator